MNTGLKIKKYLIIVFAYLAVLYPLWVRYGSLNWALDSTLIPNLFPMFGLLAFTILWLHVISGVFEPWLRKHFDFDRFVDVTSTIVLISIILHPLLLFINLDFKIGSLIFSGSKYIWFGIIGWFLLITYDIGRVLRKREFFSRHWRSILFISTIGIILIFFHSLGLGSDLQSGPLRAVWIFYGVTAILATIYNFGIKKLVG